MSRLEMLEPSTWEAFVGAPASVLMLGKSDCPACNQWTTELEAFLETDAEWPDVRFGKLLLDRPGWIGFKKANPWVAEVHDLPFNVIFVGGESRKQFPGGGVDRMVSRLRRLLREG